jgi:hypothetical protein
MAIETQTTQERAYRNIAIFESKLSQTVPATDKAFFRVISVGLAMIETEQVKKLADDAKQNLAISATSGLTDLGADRGIVQDKAVATVLTITVPGTNGTIIPATRSWVNTTTGIRYFAAASAPIASGTASIQVTADTAGTAGNMSVSETLSIDSSVPGASDTGTVASVDITGAEEESQESFRSEILEDQRSQCGGANSADYRKWANVVEGVAQSYPYSGLPWDDAGVDAPPDRTVYVEADTTIDPDGIPPTSLLDQVEAAIINNPDSGAENQPLGIENSTLYVEPIRRTPIYTEVRGLDVPATQLSSIQTQIENGIEAFLRSLQPFIDGLDFVGDKNSIVSDPILSRLVQDIVDTVGGSFDGLAFGLTAVNFIPSYEMGEGETAKSGGVVFA